MGIPRRTLLIFALLGTISLGGYLLASRAVYATGFPLDDAWIHQTYARNLARSGEWAFQPGELSGGSTAPLWTALLSVGHRVGLGPIWTAYLFGWLCLWGLGGLGFCAARQLQPGFSQTLAAGAGALLILEWHLVWAAGSGMETLLFASLVLAVLAWLLRAWKGREKRGRRDGWMDWLGTGCLVGLSVWVRPDGITLLGPALLVGWLAGGNLSNRLRIVMIILAGFATLFIPYLFFNRALTDAFWPTTLYAKQAEYAALLAIPFPRRFLNLAVLPLVGAGVLLLPGFIINFWRHIRGGEWAAAAGALWALGYLGSYALRLPVTYQHGRYLIPVIPVLCVWGWAASAGMFRMRSPLTWQRVLSRAWLASLGIVLAAFWIRGAQAYAWDVAVIESEMSAAARWVAQYTSPGTLVAAHDIGALGYFGERPLLDLAGLISPEVIPYITDESALEEYLDARGASYLVTFPGWYPALSRRGSPVYSTGGRFSPGLGGENMTVYDWQAGDR
jgi:hypothetical protein